MAKPYSEDLRRRVVETIEGGTTIPEAAEQCGVSISSVVRFLKLHRETGSVDPAKFGGYKAFKLAESRRSPGFLRDTSNSRHTSWPRRPKGGQQSQRKNAALPPGRSHRTSGRQRSGNGGKPRNG